MQLSPAPQRSFQVALSAADEFVAYLRDGRARNPLKSARKAAAKCPTHHDKNAGAFQYASGASYPPYMPSPSDQIRSGE